jgi:hypothetical protein
MIRHSHEFLLIPSDRLPDGNKKREQLMLELSSDALGSWLGCISDRRRAKRFQGGCITKDPYWKPGAMIERQPEHIREQLRRLKSDDISETDLTFLFQYGTSAYEDENYEYGFGGAKALTPRTVWKLPGSNPDRCP